MDWTCLFVCFTSRTYMGYLSIQDNFAVIDYKCVKQLVAQKHSHRAKRTEILHI